MLLKIVKPRPTVIISAIPPKKDVMKDSLLQSEWLLLSFLYFLNCNLLFNTYKNLILDFPCFHTCLLFKFILRLCKAIFFLL